MSKKRQWTKIANCKGLAIKHLSKHGLGIPPAIPILPARGKAMLSRHHIAPRKQSLRHEAMTHGRKPFRQELSRQALLGIFSSFEKAISPTVLAPKSDTRTQTHRRKANTLEWEILNSPQQSSVNSVATARARNTQGAIVRAESVASAVGDSIWALHTKKTQRAGCYDNADLGQTNSVYASGLKNSWQLFYSSQRSKSATPGSDGITIPTLMPVDVRGEKKRSTANLGSRRAEFSANRKIGNVSTQSSLAAKADRIMLMRKSGEPSANVQIYPANHLACPSLTNEGMKCWWLASFSAGSSYIDCCERSNDPGLGRLILDQAACSFPTTVHCFPCGFHGGISVETNANVALVGFQPPTARLAF